MHADVHTVPTHGVLRLSRLLAVRDAAVAGAGLASVPEFIVMELLADGHLVRVGPDWRSPLTELQLVYPSRRRLLAGDPGSAENPHRAWFTRQSANS